ncbi:MAG: hypothetical protein HFH66_15440 [Lachnospiraceae bacterium]|nr:hypothetical protein [Lachnospiraceae bacterium]
MKKLIIYFILTFLLTLLSAINLYINVSGSTFTMPSDNNSSQENNKYHQYNIENKYTKSINKYNIHDNNITNKKNNLGDNIKNKSGNNKPDTNNIKQNIQNNNTPVPYSTTNNTNYNKNSNGFDKNKTNKKTGKNKTNNKINNNKTNNKNINSNNSNNNNSISKKPVSNITSGNNNINNIIIEFSKHFIKIPVGKTINISLKIKPNNLSYKKIIYTSDNNSVAIYKNNKITGIKKGFTTVLIKLPDGTIKAACPVKVF